MADQNRDRLLEHSYDGIQEYDNPMPRWWVIIFWLTIVFSILYWLNVPGVGKGPGRIASYEADMARARAAQLQREPTGGPSAEQLALLATDANVVRSGKALFAQHCVACHRADGGGLIGPNLTDEYWIHGGTPSEIRATIDAGVLAKGMPPWGKVLPPDQVTAVSVYVGTLRGTNPANGKAPEGNKGTP
jgi:cytochrome c oxidase cbb3-type subunit 3